MHRERDMTCPVFYVPFDGVEQEASARAGAAWLKQQPGSPLILVGRKRFYTEDEWLPSLTRGVPVATPDALHPSGWRGGPVLAPWPTEPVFEALSERLGSAATAVCVLMWGWEPSQSAWLQAHGARHLATGEPFGRPEDLVLSPVVAAAMRFLTGYLNGLTRAGERDVAVLAFQRLHGGGYDLDADRLYAWSIAHGMRPTEAARLREIAQKVCRGHRFRLTNRDALRPDILNVWRAEAEGGAA